MELLQKSRLQRAIRDLELVIETLERNSVTEEDANSFSRGYKAATRSCAEMVREEHERLKSVFDEIAKEDKEHV